MSLRMLSKKSQNALSSFVPTPNQLAKQLGMIQLDTTPDEKDAILAELVIRPLTS